MFDVPMELPTLHEYSPMMSANLASMVSVFLYVEVILSTRVCNCVRENVVPLVIKVSPSFIHMTLVGGEQVEVQVRVEREEERLHPLPSHEEQLEGIQMELHSHSSCIYNRLEDITMHAVAVTYC